MRPRVPGRPARPRTSLPARTWSRAAALRPTASARGRNRLPGARGRGRRSRTAPRPRRVARCRSARSRAGRRPTRSAGYPGGCWCDAAGPRRSPRPPGTASCRSGRCWASLPRSARPARKRPAATGRGSPRRGGRGASPRRPPAPRRAAAGRPVRAGRRPRAIGPGAPEGGIGTRRASRAAWSSCRVDAPLRETAHPARDPLIVRLPWPAHWGLRSTPS